MLDRVTLTQFLPHLETWFDLETGTGPREKVRLIVAEAVGTPGPARPAHLRGREPFSLVFLAPPEAQLEQRIYRLRHPVLGDCELFLVPVGRDAHGLRLEAIFN